MTTAKDLAGDKFVSWVAAFLRDLCRGRKEVIFAK